MFPKNSGIMIGDIVLSSGTTYWSKIIKYTTHSKWSHVGIVVETNWGGLVIAEALKKRGVVLKIYKFEDLISDKYMVRRLKGFIYSHGKYKLLSEVIFKFQDFKYGICSRLKKIVCSEYVYEMLNAITEGDLESDRSRFVISPKKLAYLDKLKTIKLSKFL